MDWTWTNLKSQTLTLKDVFAIYKVFITQIYLQVLVFPVDLVLVSQDNWARWDNLSLFLDSWRRWGCVVLLHIQSVHQSIHGVVSNHNYRVDGNRFEGSTPGGVAEGLREKRGKQRGYLFLCWFIWELGSSCFKPSVWVSALTPQALFGMMYAQTGMPTMNTLNHHGLVQIRLMRTICTTVSQTPAQMNGIPFHTRRRTLIFRSPLTPPPPPLFCFFSFS